MATKSKSAFNFFRPNIFLFIVAGIWSPYYYDPDTSLRKRAYEWYHRFCLTICCGYIVQSVVEFIRVYNKVTIDEKSEFYSFIVQLMVGLLKIYFLARNEAKIRKTFQDIEGAPFQRNNDPVFDEKLKARMRTTVKIMCLFWIPIYTTIVIKLYTCAMDTKASKELFERICNQEELLNPNVTSLSHPLVDCDSYPKMIMPWITWFPFKTDTGSGHYVGISYQLLILTIFASYIFNFDMYITSWMMYITFQLELMEHDLMALRKKSELEVIRKCGSKDEEMVAQEMIRGIRTIINLHNSILRLFQQTQESLSVILLVQYFWISILICMLMIQMSEVKDIIIIAFNYVLKISYFLPRTTQRQRLSTVHFSILVWPPCRYLWSFTTPMRLSYRA